MDFTDNFISAALKEDVGAGDYTTLGCIPPNAKGSAQLKVKEAGIIAGVSLAARIFHFIEPGSSFASFKDDGDTMSAGDIAFEISADARTILTGERLVLNCMQRMSGIATLTAKYVAALNGYKTRLLDTRKTTPLFRHWEKEAVRLGGGLNHRMGLYDMIMLKDNHIDYCGGIEAAIGRVHSYQAANNLDLKIEIETRSIEDVQRVLAFGHVDRIMLDNFSPADLAQAVSLINGRYETEASGGITLENIREYAASGIDFISAGAIIHHAVSLDLSLKAIL